MVPISFSLGVKVSNPRFKTFERDPCFQDAKQSLTGVRCYGQADQAWSRRSFRSATEETCSLKTRSRPSADNASTLASNPATCSTVETLRTRPTSLFAIKQPLDAAIANYQNSEFKSIDSVFSSVLRLLQGQGLVIGIKLALQTS